MVKLEGTVERILYYNNDWASFILEKNDGDSVTCVGNVHDFKSGIDVEINAEEVVHPKYGLQYQIKFFKLSAPHGVEGIKAFLESGIVKGIGPKTAEKIVNRFGDRTLNIIRQFPDELLSISGVTAKKLEALKNAVSEFYIHEEIFNLTNGNITMSEISKIIRRYKDDSVNILKNQPYRLWKDIDGFGFLKNDRIALACGHPANDKNRIKAAIEYSIDQIGNTKGHCYITLDEMQEAALEVLNRIPEELRGIRGLEYAAYSAYNDWEEKAEELIAKYSLSKERTATLMDWKKKNDMFVELLADAIYESEMEGNIILDGEYVASKRLYNTEKDIATSILEMLKKEPLCNNKHFILQFISDYEKQTGIHLSEEQKAAVLMGLTNRISIITGGPGRGKTTIIRFLVEFWMKYMGSEGYNSGDVILLAPTGRAAQRIKESLGGIRGVDVSTIHKMTGVFSLSDDDTDTLGRLGKPMRDAHRNTLIICDECSMIDVILGKHLMAFSELSSIILVGDKDQLPPVGPGNMFRDLIRSGVIPVTELATCYRNAGLIAENAEKINRGSAHITAGDTFAIETMPREEMAEKIRDDYMSLIHAGVKAKDICVIALQRKRGAVAVNVLNGVIQDAYNPLKTSVDPVLSGFRVGDRVMQIRNKYQAEYRTANGNHGTGVFNGDLGTVTRVDPEERQLTVEFDDGRRVEYDGPDLEDLVMAYAMTVHKVQGSEFKYVLFALSKDQYMLLSKEAVYTAVTRAKDKVIAYMEKGVLWMALQKEGAGTRNTRLSEYLLYL